METGITLIVDSYSRKRQANEGLNSAQYSLNLNVSTLQKQ